MNAVHLRLCGWIVAIAIAGLVIAGPASAERVDLNVFENSSGADVSGLDLWVDVTSSGGYVDMKFNNDSTISAILTQIYLESNLSSLLNNGMIYATTGNVHFVPGANPSSPPGGTNIGWVGEFYTAGRVKAGGVSNGIDDDAVDPDESLTLRFDLLTGKTLDDVLSSLVDDGRVAGHVQGLPRGASVSVVTVPLPVAGSAGLAMLGAIGLARVVRGRARRR